MLLFRISSVCVGCTYFFFLSAQNKSHQEKTEIDMNIDIWINRKKMKKKKQETVIHQFRIWCSFHKN